MIKNSKLIIFTIFILLFAPSCLSQNFGVINIEYVINNNHQFKAIIKDILAAQELKKNSFIKQEEIINTQLNELESSKLMLSDQEIKLRIDEYNKILGDFNDSVNEFNLHYDNQILKIKNKVLENILELLQKYATENKIDLIFDNKNYIIASNKIDITDIIFKELESINLKLSFDPL